MRLKELNNDYDEPRASLGDAPYAVGWSGQSHEWYGELESPGEEGKGRYKPKGDGGRIVAINVPDYATAQKIEKKLDDSYNAGKFIDGNSVHGGMGDGYYVDYHSAWIRPMHEMDDEMWRLEYDKPKDFGLDTPKKKEKSAYQKNIDYDTARHAAKTKYAKEEDNIDDAIKLASSMGGDMTGATSLIRKKYGDEVLQNPKVQAALQHANENIQTEKQKAGPAGQLKGKDVIKKQKAGTTKNPTRDLLVGEVDTDEAIKIVRRDQPAAKVGSAVSAADRLANRGAASVDGAMVAQLARRVSKIERAMHSIGESKISRAYFKELENKLTEIKEELKISEGDNIYHDCAKSFTHNVYGECTVIPGEHTLLEDGTVTHYDATFTSCGNTYKVGNVAVENMHNVISEYHAHKKKKAKKKVKEALDDDVKSDSDVFNKKPSPFDTDISDLEHGSQLDMNKPWLGKYQGKIKDVKHLTAQFTPDQWYKMIFYVNKNKWKGYTARQVRGAAEHAYQKVGPGTQNLTVSSYLFGAHQIAGFKHQISGAQMTWDKTFEYFSGILKKAEQAGTTTSPFKGNLSAEKLAKLLQDPGGVGVDRSSEWIIEKLLANVDTKNVDNGKKYWGALESHFKNINNEKSLREFFDDKLDVESAKIVNSILKKLGLPVLKSGFATADSWITELDGQKLSSKTNIANTIIKNKYYAAMIGKLKEQDKKLWCYCTTRSADKNGPDTYHVVMQKAFVKKLEKQGDSLTKEKFDKLFWAWTQSMKVMMDPGYECPTS